MHLASGEDQTRISGIGEEGHRAAPRRARRARRSLQPLQRRFDDVRESGRRRRGRRRAPGAELERLARAVLHRWRLRCGRRFERRVRSPRTVRISARCPFEARSRRRARVVVDRRAPATALVAATARSIRSMRCRPAGSASLIRPGGASAAATASAARAPVARRLDRLDPRRVHARERLDVGGERRVVLAVIGRVVADDVDDRREGAARVVQVGEAVAEPGPEVQQGAGRAAAMRA